MLTWKINLVDLHLQILVFYDTTLVLSWKSVLFLRFFHIITAENCHCHIVKLAPKVKNLDPEHYVTMTIVYFKRR